VAAYLDAKSNSGKFILRIEDLDPPREIKGSDLEIIRTLELYGFEWDGPIIYQSQRTELYESALAELDKKELIYRCQCSRKYLRANAQAGPSGLIYPNTCRSLNIPSSIQHAIRLKVPNKLFKVKDLVFGHLEQNLQSDLGDFIIRRSDFWFAYQFAVVIDDAAQNITDVVRGFDLFDSTPRQIYLQQILAYPTPNYLHLPLAIHKDQCKLSKQTNAPPISKTKLNSTLIRCLKFLGQKPPADLQNTKLDLIWQWAIQHWQTKLISKQNIVVKNNN